MPVTEVWLEDVERWAKGAFPLTFKVVKDYIEAHKVVVDVFDVYESRYKQQGFSLGTETKNDIHCAVHASAAHDKAAVCFYFDSQASVLTHAPHNVAKSLREPFACLVSGSRSISSEASVDAFVQYLYLVDHRPVSSKFDFDAFEENFEDACYAVYEWLAQQGRRAGTVDHCLHLRYNPNDLPLRIAAQSRTKTTSTVSSPAVRSVPRSAPLTAAYTVPHIEGSPAILPTALPGTPSAAAGSQHTSRAPSYESDTGRRKNLDAMVAALNAELQEKEDMSTKIHDLEVKLASEKTARGKAEAKAKEFKKNQDICKKEVDKLRRKAERSEQEVASVKRSLAEDEEEARQRLDRIRKRRLTFG